MLIDAATLSLEMMNARIDPQRIHSVLNRSVIDVSTRLID